LVNEYLGRLRLYHIDAYRLGSGYELDALGFDEMCSAADSAVAIEWAERVSEVLPGQRVEIEIRFLGASDRSLVLTPVGERGARLVASLDSLNLRQ
jgi:tRNA A37 threonylcarbamoyladenosine biosynthesis protein TsaE